jgi:hypothetical protein
VAVEAPEKSECVAHDGTANIRDSVDVGFEREAEILKGVVMIETNQARTFEEWFTSKDYERDEKVSILSAARAGWVARDAELAAKDRTITDLQAQLSEGMQWRQKAYEKTLNQLAKETIQLRDELSTSRQKEQKLIEHFEKRIETEVSKVAQLLRDRQAERAAVLTEAAELCRKNGRDCAEQNEPECGPAHTADAVYIESLIPTTDRSALDRLMEHEKLAAYNRGYLAGIDSVCRTEQSEIDRIIEEKVREGRSDEAKKWNEAMGFHATMITDEMRDWIAKRHLELRALPAAPPKENTDAR